MTRLICIQADGSEQVIECDTRGEPPLKILQHLVGGYIEAVPHGVKYQGETRRAFVDEDGRAKQLPLNERGSRMWLDQLGEGPFRYPPVVFGPLVIVVADEVRP